MRMSREANNQSFAELQEAITGENLQLKSV